MSDPTPHRNPIKIRPVYSSNLDYEFDLIRHVIETHSFAAMDTEFPGVAFRPDPIKSDPTRTPLSLYNILKTNVNVLNLIQIGLTLADENNNSPYVWEFNFCEFDLRQDCYDVDSIDLLRKQGTDFGNNRKFGIELVRFAELMMSSGLVMGGVTWVTFHSAYDFGYLIKALTGRRLPEGLPEFLQLVKVFFGDNVFDLKAMMRYCDGLYGGLDKVAKTMGVNRAVGKTHQAGSDSLLTWHVFEKIRQQEYFKKKGVEKFAGVLYGLEEVK